MSFLLTALITVKQPLKHYYYYYVLVRLWLKGTLLYLVVYRASKGGISLRNYSDISDIYIYISRSACLCWVRLWLSIWLVLRLGLHL